MQGGPESLTDGGGLRAQGEPLRQAQLTRRKGECVPSGEGPPGDLPGGGALSGVSAPCALFSQWVAPGLLPGWSHHRTAELAVTWAGLGAERKFSDPGWKSRENFKVRRERVYRRGVFLSERRVPCRLLLVSAHRRSRWRPHLPCGTYYDRKRPFSENRQGALERTGVLLRGPGDGTARTWATSRALG